MSSQNPGSSINCRNNPEIAQPGGHYSHVCVANGIAYISGQLPVDPSGKPLGDRPFQEQVQQVLRNVDGCLATVKATRKHLVQVRVYVTDIGDWPEFNRIYAEWIGEHRPARAVAGVASLHYGTSIEIEAIAVA